MRSFDIKTIGPALVVLAIMVIPLVVWSASSDGGSGGDADLVVEWDPSKPGDPLLTVTLAERLNKRETAENGKDVKLECVDGAGNVVAETTQPLPFGDDEPGYGPHAHQLVPRDKVGSVEKCRLEGSRVELEGELREGEAPGEIGAKEVLSPGWTRRRFVREMDGNELAVVPVLQFPSGATAFRTSSLS